MSSAAHKLPFEDFQFSSLTILQQRGMIRDYLRRFPEQLGLIGESVNEHALSDSLTAALLAGDLEQVGQLVDACVRGYLGSVIEKDKEMPKCN